jgi:hypothetical protein
MIGKNLNTKDTKYHEGILSRTSSWDFVSFVGEAFRLLPQHDLS